MPYAEILDVCKGIMPEFINPKYADASKTVFKKPTRLECMMQDFPSVLTGSDTKRVAFTSVSADLCFSPVKNSAKDGALLQAQGTHPACAASAGAHFRDPVGRAAAISTVSGAPEGLASRTAVLRAVFGEAYVWDARGSCLHFRF